MIKVCSFLPAVTQMIYDMGLQDHLYGITFECPQRALKEKTPVVRCILEGKNYSSLEIDALFSASKHNGKSLYYVEQALLEDIEPDIIFTQDVCDVCQIDTECTAAAVANLKKQPELISITPQSLNDVFDNAVTIAKAMGQEEKAYIYLNKLHKRVDKVVDALRASKVLPKRISLLEWIAPIYNCGHWIPHQIAYAGGTDMLSNPSGDSIVTSWEKIVKYDPEILVVAPCGFTIERTLEEMHLLTENKEWKQLAAVRNNAVFIADYELFTQSSAGTLVDGIELLAGLFHPDAIETPKRLLRNYRRFSKDLLVVK